MSAAFRCSSNCLARGPNQISVGCKFLFLQSISQQLGSKIHHHYCILCNALAFLRQQDPDADSDANYDSNPRRAFAWEARWDEKEVLEAEADHI